MTAPAANTDDREPAYGVAPVLFAPGTAPAVRRRRLVFLAVWGLVSLALIWPVYPQLAALTPRFLGLPLFFAWVIAALAAMFVALLWLFLRDDHQRPER